MCTSVKALRLQGTDACSRRSEFYASVRTVLILSHNSDGTEPDFVVIIMLQLAVIDHRLESLLEAALAPSISAVLRAT